MHPRRPHGSRVYVNAMCVHTLVGVFASDAPALVTQFVSPSQKPNFPLMTNLFHDVFDVLEGGPPQDIIAPPQGVRTSGITHMATVREAPAEGRVVSVAGERSMVPGPNLAARSPFAKSSTKGCEGGDVATRVKLVCLSR